MKKKTVVALVVLSLVALLVLLYRQVSENAVGTLYRGVPEVQCGEAGPCTTCMVGGAVCSCDNAACRCGERTVNRSTCT